MQAYKDGVYIFVETLKRRLGIILTKSPSWQTIRNGAVRALMVHKAYRNGEKKITGGGDRESCCYVIARTRTIINNIVYISNTHR